MLDQYVELLGACAQGGAQAAGEAILWLQIVLIAVVVMGAALLVASIALLGAPYVAQSEWAQRQRLWERISAACASDVAGTRMIGRTVAWLVAPEELEEPPAEQADGEEPAEGQAERREQSA